MLVQYSSDLLVAVQRNDENAISFLVRQLSNSSKEEAFQVLKDDTEKIVFWCNYYNALLQLKAKEHQTDFENDWSGFFKLKLLTLFGEKFSFDFIEHHVLRKSKWKYGLGYFNLFFASRFEKEMRVNQIDHRIHFVLNCGAQSCPIIRPLFLDSLEEELANAEKDYLESETIVSNETKTITLNQLFLFYVGDFGGKKGIKKILLNHQLIRADQLNYSLKFIPFDKRKKLNYFRD